MGERVDWSDLPKQLLPEIGKSLDAQIDVLRFRSVCSSWRSSVPPFHANAVRFPLQFPDPCDGDEQPALVFLCQSTLYYIQPVNPSTSSPLSHKGWLIKVEESNLGKLHLVDPLGSKQHIGRYVVTPKPLNLFNFRVVELTKAYTLKYRVRAGNERTYYPSSHHIPRVKKVVMFPNSAWTDANMCSIFLILDNGILGFAKCGDEKLTIVNDESSDYDDIVIYKGQFYVVDKLGIVSWIDCSSLKLVQFSPPLCGLGSQKHLVESCGALYVVDKYLDSRGISTIGFRVYKLDEEWGQWVLVKSLGNQVFILGDDCSFSVSDQEFSGFQGNFIHFIDSRYGSCVFNLKDQSIQQLTFSQEHPFWPPPTW